MILGYILNLVTTPMYINFFEIAFTNVFVTEFIVSIIYGDILQFAGIAMIIFAFFRKLKLNDNIILMIGILLSLITSVAPTINTNSYYVAAVGGTFVPTVYDGTEVFACFPFSTWFIFPAFGYWFGNRLKNVKNLNMFYLIIGGVSLLILGVGVGMEVYYKAFMMSAGDVEFYLMRTYDGILSIFTPLAMYAICYFIVKILPGKINDIITSIGKSLNVIYILSWIIIVYTQVLIYCFVEEVTGLPLYLGMAATSVVSIYLGVKIKKKFIRKLEKKPDSFIKYINV